MTTNRTSLAVEKHLLRGQHAAAVSLTGEAFEEYLAILEKYLRMEEAATALTSPPQEGSADFEMPTWFLLRLVALKKALSFDPLP